VRFLLKRTLGGFAPADDAAIAAMRKFRVGEVYRVDIVRPRNYKSLQRWWVLCQMIADNSEIFHSKDQVSDFLKIRCGHAITVVAQSSGECFMVADSIDYDALSEEEFQELWKKAIDVVIADILPAITRVEIDTEIQKIMGTAA
jgi:hypothetical protein